VVDISDEQLFQAYMGGLKEDIKNDLFLRRPTHIMESMEYDCHIQENNTDTNKYTNGAYTGSGDHFRVHKTSISRPTKLTPQ